MTPRKRAVARTIFTKEVMLKICGAVIAASTFGQMFLQYKAAIRVEAVRLELQESREESKSQLADVAARVEVVHKATNSLTDRLVETTKSGALLQGAKDEKKRADAEKDDNQGAK